MCNLVFQISILSPDVVRYMVSESGGLSRGKLYIWPQQSFDIYGGTILSDNYNAITLGNGWIHRWVPSLLTLPDRVVS